MAFRGYRKAKETQRSKNKTNTSQTSNKNKKTNKKKNNKTKKKNRQQTQDKNTECWNIGSKRCDQIPFWSPKGAKEGILVAPFWAYILWETANRPGAKKRTSAKTAPKNQEVERGQKSIIRFEPTKQVVSWDREKPFRTEEAPAPKVYKKMVTIWLPIRGLACQKRQNTLRFKRIFRNSRLCPLHVSKSPGFF